MSISVIIPAHQEAAYIDHCLAAMLAQDLLAPGAPSVEVIVVANACTDTTVAQARAWTLYAAARDLDLVVIDRPEPGKHGALNAGDAAARGDLRVYLDADVVCGPALLRLLAAALDDPAPRYASGRLTTDLAHSWVSRCYARIWSGLPFVARDVSGCGLYAVNAAGRRRWGDFPAIHSDDKFVRLQFAPDERIGVAAPYLWPVPEGWRNLVKVRRRWCEGNAELARTYPELRANDETRCLDRGDWWRLLSAAPASLLVFAVVFGLGHALAYGAPPTAQIKWRRGR